MVAFTQLVSAFSMALLATTAVASPTLMAARQPPPTSSVIDFTLYKTTLPGYEDQCWFGVDIVHVSPNDLTTVANGAHSTVCNTADFYVLRIDHLATGYNCQINVFSDDCCNNQIGSYTYDPTWAPCTLPSSSGLVDLHSWVVNCQE